MTKKSKIIVDDRASAKRLTTALHALRDCTEVERQVVFRQLGTCACATIRKATHDNPATVVGGLLCAVLAEALVPSKKPSGDVTTVSKDVVASIVKEFDPGRYTAQKK